MVRRQEGGGGGVAQGAAPTARRSAGHGAGAQQRAHLALGSYFIRARPLPAAPRLEQTALGIEHRLAPSRHLQTNGMVKRFNRRAAEVIKQTRLESQPQNSSRR